MSLARFVLTTFELLAVAAAVLMPATAYGQAAANRPAPPSGYRRLAPGVETTIAVQADPEETISYHDMVEVLVGVPNLDWTPFSTSTSRTLKALAQNVPFRRTVWNLEFTFKPLRMIEVDLPQAGGKMERRVVWYMVYRVKNNGRHLKPALEREGTWVTQQVDFPVHFFPQFVIDGLDAKKVYLDEVIPAAIDPIRKREDPNRKLLNTVEIGRSSIPISTEDEDKSVWGVATWEGIDPRIDFFSIYVKGLSNAYKWTDPKGAFKAGDRPATGREYTQKTLQLNFWRPGDEFNPNEEEFFYGIPGKVDYLWIFR